MNKPLMVTMIALTLSGIALTTLPTAAATSCSHTVSDYVTHTCTYCVFGSEDGILSNHEPDDVDDFVACAAP